METKDKEKNVKMCSKIEVASQERNDPYGLYIFIILVHLQFGLIILYMDDDCML